MWSEGIVSMSRLVAGVVLEGHVHLVWTTGSRKVPSVCPAECTCKPSETAQEMKERRKLNFSAHRPVIDCLTGRRVEESPRIASRCKLELQLKTILPCGRRSMGVRVRVWGGGTLGVGLAQCRSPLPPPSPQPPPLSPIIARDRVQDTPAAPQTSRADLPKRSEKTFTLVRAGVEIGFAQRPFPCSRLT